jgi:putative transposase
MSIFDLKANIMARPTSPIILSPEQHALLQVIVHSREVPHSLVQRAQIVLAAGAGRHNNAIGEELGLCEETVGLWRQRWVQGSVALEPLEHQPKRLREAVGQVLADQPRPGCPATFTAEQICQILALACERPPEQFSHWTRQELVREVIRRGIAEQISETSIGRFLKSGGVETSPDPILAEPRGGGRSRLPARRQDGVQTVSPGDGTP